MGRGAALPGALRQAQRANREAEEPARVLIVSTREYPEVVEYLDGDKIGVRSSPPGEPNRLSLNFRRGSAVGYFD